MLSLVYLYDSWSFLRLHYQNTDLVSMSWNHLSTHETTFQNRSQCPLFLWIINLIWRIYFIVWPFTWVYGLVFVLIIKKLTKPKSTTPSVSLRVVIQQRHILRLVLWEYSVYFYNSICISVVRHASYCRCNVFNNVCKAQGTDVITTW